MQRAGQLVHHRLCPVGEVQRIYVWLLHIAFHIRLYCQKARQWPLKWSEIPVVHGETPTTWKAQKTIERCNEQRSELLQRTRRTKKRERSTENWKSAAPEGDLRSTRNKDGNGSVSIWKSFGIGAVRGRCRFYGRHLSNANKWQSIIRGSWSSRGTWKKGVLVLIAAQDTKRSWDCSRLDGTSGISIKGSHT